METEHKNLKVNSLQPQKKRIQIFINFIEAKSNQKLHYQIQ